MIKIKPADLDDCRNLYIAQLSAVYFARAKATGTNSNGGGRTINDCLNLANIGLPTSVGLAVGVRNVLTEYNAFSANRAFCHP